MQLISDGVFHPRPVLDRFVYECPFERREDTPCLIKECNEDFGGEFCMKYVMDYCNRYNWTGAIYFFPPPKNARETIGSQGSRKRGAWLKTQGMREDAQRGQPRPQPLALSALCARTRADSGCKELAKHLNLTLDQAEQPEEDDPYKFCFR